MSDTPVPPPPPPPPPPALNSECFLCGNEVSSATNRCTQCGMHQQVGPQRPNPFVGRALAQVWLTGVAVYLTVLAIVAVVPHAK
jgi:hypothetical protein